MCIPVDVGMFLGIADTVFCLCSFEKDQITFDAVFMQKGETFYKVQTLFHCLVANEAIGYRDQERVIPHIDTRLQFLTQNISIACENVRTN